MIRERFRQLYRRLIPLLFSRRQYKLFLKSAIGELELRRLQLAAAADYFSPGIRAIPVKAPFGKSLLVIAPHQDDEVIGCGGALALQVRSGRKAQVLLLQDGADEHEGEGLTRAALTELRNAESRRAAALLQIEPIFLNLQDLKATADVAATRISELIQRHRIDAVFAPFVLDGHPDHRTTNQILAAALKGVSWPVRVLGYEVWGLCIPNVLVVIDEVMDLKLQMLACFPYANHSVDYLNSTQGLNMYRSRLLGAGECRYAECFFELPRSEYIELVERLALIR